MGNKTGVGMGIGGISMLAIFVVLCLTTLAVLSVVSARADFALTEKTAAASKQYYEADARAEEKLASLLSIVETGGNWYDYALSEGFDVFSRRGAAIIAYTAPISESKELYIEVELAVSAAGSATGQWTRTVWQTRVIE